MACGVACSLLFQARVVTDTQSWHSESGGSHSCGREPRAGRAAEEAVRCALQKCRPCAPCTPARQGQLTWARAVLGGAPEDQAADQLGQHTAEQRVQQEDGVLLG